jgi:hypothetical protein
MLTDSDSNAVIAIYETHPEAETAVQALQQAGFDMTKLSVVGKDYHTEEHVVGYYLNEANPAGLDNHVLKQAQQVAAAQPTAK